MADAFDRWYRLIVETAQEGIWLIDADGRTLLVNPKVTEILGYSAEELVGKPVTEVVVGELRGEVERRLAERRAGMSESQWFEVRMPRRGGSIADISLSTAAIYEDGVYVGSLAMFSDVTERKRIERELAASEERLHSLAENAVDVLYRYRLVPEPGWDYLSPAVERITGYTPEEHYADPELAERTMHPDDYALVRDRAPGELPTEPATQRYFHKDGHLVWIERRNWIVRDAEGRPVAIEGIGRDVTAHVLADQELRRSEASFRAVFDNSRAAMLIVDDDRRYLEANDAACELLGLPCAELLGKRIEDFSLHPEQAEAGWKSFIETGTREGTYHVLRPDGEVRLVEFTATANVQPGRHLSVLYDVTERRHLEEQLRQAQKMEAIGQLAGGVAHDFNNQLGAIRLTAELALNHFGNEERLAADLRQIVDITYSGGSLTRQLLAFSRKQPLSPCTLDLNESVRAAEQLLGRLIGEHILIESRLHPEPLYVHVDPSQLEQVLVNLAVNARDALGRGGGLTIATSVEPALDDLPAGRYAALAVSDTGVGMDAATLARVFEPFFTTKPLGEGTGLGLATAYGFAQQSGGTLRADSEPGRGATFTLLLPLAESAGPPEPEIVAEVAQGTETVLLVEDEPAVRDIVGAMLAACGYEVISAEGPATALELAAARPPPIHLLLTDVLMPGMDGAELAVALRATHPETRVLFMSGYAADSLADSGFVAVLQKPFGAAELSAAVRQALAE